MKRASFIAWIPLYQALAGACDFITGLLLMAAPGWTLRFMGLKHSTGAPELISFIGAFVAGVGLAYLITVKPNRQADYSTQIRTTWLITGLSRALVATYLSCRVWSGAMEPAWIVVALTDGVLASAQLLALGCGWLPKTHEW